MYHLGPQSRCVKSRCGRRFLPLLLPVFFCFIIITFLLSLIVDWTHIRQSKKLFIQLNFAPLDIAKRSWLTLMMVDH